MLLVTAATEAIPGEEKSKAMQASIVSIATGPNASPWLVDSMECAVVKAVAEVVGAVVNAVVRNVEHATTIAMCAAPGALPQGATTIVTILEKAEVAGPGAVTSTAGSRAGSTVLCAVGSIASTISQCSGSKRKARDHSDGLRFKSKQRTSSSADNVHPDA